MSTRILAILEGALFAGFAAIVFFGERMRGFPDSYLTEYDRAVHGPRMILGYLCVGAACGLLGVGIARPRFVRTCLVAGFMLFVLAVVVDSQGFAWYFQDLDSGQGG